MVVLVTGASGFLGSHVLKRLAASGTLALGLGRDTARCAALEAAGHRIIRHDLTQPLDGALDPRLGRVERIIHCAALSSPFGRLQDFVAANVTATQNLVDFAIRQRVSRFLHISSPSVCFAFRDQLGLSEDAPLPEPVNHYARTKREAERIVLAAPAAHPVVLRPRGIYGAGDRALLPRLIKAAKSRPLPLFRDGRAQIDLTHVDDVVDAVMVALAAPGEAEGQIFNISGGEALPVRRVADEACARAGLTARWRPMPLAPAMLAAGLMETVALMLPGRPEPPVTRYGLGLFAYGQSLDLSKARCVLGWVPKISFGEGLDRTFGGAMP
ncbi:NAD(P)-dependent oxidoreductase [Mesorhizobium sp. M1E.F.Ca.ET.045.02.1.1]|uniref:NAD-dependent epimerase/dehydratase family protein n=1 Tax=unclassified Mesorhizobium TaxID=325217 RepID=UPI000F75BFB6|nr:MULTISPECIES: NAD(P)-dependent oxidoreductase [unclassified Mesorhizobium]AZO24736.1 NAD(P)-dependent oxidoreductase [Mesorhizobium sp. M1E.F.Ca.ET.045.02.1.1]RUW29037.1 NAD-dependent epimerase/dehydratase family protein [Mesorhizobium sp. M1E.F.Ca.ET.041.01.1.1]RUW84218.1 NAD-dependent epimerase/dehydratase family protein [Mesorhizobium sp. M1E.F.Ca.ET.063.01.1.1]RWD88199.1 MAG: NAD-dependent epimerase/dehydratase family protein [Mesorhizobium sp.]